MLKNRIEVAGNLGGNVESRFLPSGTRVANVRLCESYTFTDHKGQSQKRTNWWNLSFLGELATVAGSFEKGDHVFVEGTVEQREFTPQDGSKRIVYEIVVRSCHGIADKRKRQAASPVVEAEPASNSGVYDVWPVA